MIARLVAKLSRLCTNVRQPSSRLVIRSDVMSIHGHFKSQSVSARVELNVCSAPNTC